MNTNNELFDIFTSKEEYNAKKDEHGRFLFSFSKKSKCSILTPAVSEWLITNNVLDVDWPENYNAAACLTHDIDRIHPSYKYTFYTGVKSIFKGYAIQGLNRFYGKIKHNNIMNPFWNFKDIIELEKKYEAKSSFYFKAISIDPKDAIYDINECETALSYISDNGWEIGLHGGYYSYNNLNELKKEKKKLENVLGKEVNGVRMHFLMFEIPETWQILSELGFKYDTTFGYPDIIGFRNGMCHPFKPYDLKRGREIDILEIPLTIMDTSLFSYMKLQPSDAWKTIKKLVDVVEKNKGVITILWHNTTFDEIFWGGYAKLYEKILKYLRERDFWMTSAENICHYWSKYIL